MPVIAMPMTSAAPIRSALAWRACCARNACAIHSAAVDAITATPIDAANSAGS
jgi:hypothetical protein